MREPVEVKGQPDRQTDLSPASDSFSPGRSILPGDIRYLRPSACRFTQFPRGAGTSGNAFNTSKPRPLRLCSYY